MREDIVALAEQLRESVVDERLLREHVAILDEHVDCLEGCRTNTIDPAAADQLAARMADCADRASDALRELDTAAYRRLDDEALELVQEATHLITRSGVRRALTDEQFDPIADCAVLVGELARGALGELVAIRADAQPRRRRHTFEFNPLYAFTPAIAAGCAWARERVAADDADRTELVEQLSGSMCRLLERGIAGMLCDPMTYATMRALTSFTLAWSARADTQLLDELDQLADRTIAALDGCDIDPSMLEAWVHVGASAGILRQLLENAGAGHLDTADATLLIDALDPTRYDQLDE